MKPLSIIIITLILTSICFAQRPAWFTRDSVATNNWTKYDSLAMVHAKAEGTLSGVLYIYRVYATNCFNDSTYQTTRTQLTANGVKNAYRYNYDTFHRDPNDLNAFFFFLMTGKMTESKHYIQY
jgi:hypothetical protein